MSDAENIKVVKPIKLTIQEYIDSIAISERDAFAYTKAYSKEKLKTSDEWSKFLKK